jgi:hypothetical protein
MLARILDGEIVELRDISFDDIPLHKRDWWKPVVGEPPIYNHTFDNLIGPTHKIQENQVLLTWVVEPKPAEERAEIIKGEAQRRIYEVYPQWKQANMTARTVELLQKGQSNWNEQEQAESLALNAAWDWIKAIRAKSNEIEAMDPLPADITHDSWWS